MVLKQNHNFGARMKGDWITKICGKHRKAHMKKSVFTIGLYHAGFGILQKRLCGIRRKPRSTVILPVVVPPLIQTAAWFSVIQAWLLQIRLISAITSCARRTIHCRMIKTVVSPTGSVGTWVLKTLDPLHARMISVVTLPYRAVGTRFRTSVITEVDSTVVTFCPSADRTNTVLANSSTFLMTNITPKLLFATR